MFDGTIHIVDYQIHMSDGYIPHFYPFLTIPTLLVTLDTINICIQLETTSDISIMTPITVPVLVWFMPQFVW